MRLTSYRVRASAGCADEGNEHGRMVRYPCWRVPMPQQYNAKDTRTGLEVLITGEFPPDKDDRIRIAATANLFTRLMGTILATDNATERRTLFRSLETALDWADAAARQDVEAMGLVMQKLLGELGITQEQLEEMIKRFQEGGGDLGGLPPISPN